MCKVVALLVSGLLLLVSAPAFATPSPSASAISNIQIRNVGQIDDDYYRGAQPHRGNYKQLAAPGVKTVIDLRRYGHKSEQKMVERAGMKFDELPLKASRAPKTPAITEFLKLVNDPANQPVYVHCKGGRHRTGAMTAIYRISHEK